MAIVTASDEMADGGLRIGGLRAVHIAFQRERSQIQFTSPALSVISGKRLLHTRRVWRQIQPAFAARPLRDEALDGIRRPQPAGGGRREHRI